MANCSEIFGRSEPPTNPMAAFFRNSDRSSSIAGDALYAAQIKTSPTRKEQPGGGYLYLAGGCKGAIDIE